MKAFAGKNAHFNWARKSAINGDVCVLVKIPRRLDAQRITIKRGTFPDGEMMLWGEWIPKQVKENKENV